MPMLASFDCIIYHGANRQHSTEEDNTVSPAFSFLALNHTETSLLSVKGDDNVQNLILCRFEKVCTELASTVASS